MEVTPGNRACVLGRAPANTQIELEVDTERSLECGSSFDHCEVTVAGDKITLAMVAYACVYPDPHPCPFEGTFPKLTCFVPGLLAGRYTVEVTGEGPHAARELVVREDGSKVSKCSLPNLDQPPPPLDAAYDATCDGDEDCHVATFGNVCQPCLCPNGAVTSSALDTYEADFRARTSQCKSSGTVACGPCVAKKAVCEKAQGQLQGTCVLRDQP
jgi:hypothetical protein